MDLSQEDPESSELKELAVFTQIESLNRNIVLTGSSVLPGNDGSLVLGNNEYEHKFIRVVSTADPTKVHLNPNELFVCNKCNRTFKQKSRFDRHVMNHPSEKNYLCKVCNKVFTRLPHLQKHMRTHSDERKYVCETCGAAFILQHHLVRHNRIHTGVLPFQCDVCHKQFTRKAGLTQHQFVHTGMKPFVCSVGECDRQFSDRTTLRRHVLTHTCEKPFICKECEKTFRTKSACRKHYLRHFKPGEAFKCGICEEMFKTELLLQEHSAVHEQRAKSGIYRCGFCLRVFMCQKALDSHVVMHENKLFLNCDKCDAKFYTQKDLQDHVRTHENKTIFPPSTEVLLQNQSMEDDSIKKTLNPDDYINIPPPTETTNDDAGKLMMVIQLPDNQLNVNNGCFQNIQQYLGNAHIDRLLITTNDILRTNENINETNNKTVELKLSIDQRNDIEKILQNANLTNNREDFIQNITQPPEQVLLQESNEQHHANHNSAFINITANIPTHQPTHLNQSSFTVITPEDQATLNNIQINLLKTESQNLVGNSLECTNQANEVSLLGESISVGDKLKHSQTSVFTKPIIHVHSADIFNNILHSSKEFESTNDLSSEKQIVLNEENDSSSIVLTSNEEYFL